MRRTRGVTRSGCLFRAGIGIQAQLEIDSPHVIRLTMQQHRLIAVKRRIEPEPALSREVRFHCTSAIRKRSLNVRPWVSRPMSMRTGCARRRRRPRIAAAQHVGPSGVSTCSVLRSVALRARRGPCFSSASRDRASPRAFEQIPFDVILLQVDERGPLVARFGQQIERVHQVVAARTPCRRSSSRPWRPSVRHSPGGRRSPACAWQSRWRASRWTTCGRRPAPPRGCPVARDRSPRRGPPGRRRPPPPDSAAQREPRRTLSRLGPSERQLWS